MNAITQRETAELERRYSNALRNAVVRHYNRYRFYNALEPVIEGASNAEMQHIQSLLAHAIDTDGAGDSDEQLGCKLREIAERYLKAGAEAAL
jgi:hypothetical protein